MSAFEGRKIVVTGATRGIGRAIAEAFLIRGATVFGVYAGNRQAAETMAAVNARYGERLQLSQLDVTDYQAVAAYFIKLEEEQDTLDILVNNAGIRRDAVLAMMREEDWRRVIDVNLSGSFNMSKLSLPLMLKQRYGRIIFITSPISYLGFAGQANYAASKAGQIGLMKSLAKEVAKRKITVNCVSPGFIHTEFIADLPDEQVKTYKKMVPANRFGTPDEVAEAVLFLAGDRAAYINGAVLEVTGGL
ncbi:3-oxoacyl-ACP reductase FabG [Desulfobulbus oligotrophicus]|uniref:3-oxoacyl-ACP reductase FabG n=1 Tax=Desulfobulbus oligotrophicus TaxID=1909699 RepID=A0A7T5VCP8_9BACT|nr:3-oxoacyl-ACP reductase FabG [Desulfobulbus oligotrophicus]QQG65381.1 3-oxoacyl-ACP reductase FabG [Desulfobulbus oligotrophicus]